MVVYLDHAATTPMLPEALDTYLEALAITGNPSSIHSAGQNARRVLEESRERLADIIGCEPIEVIFTSGGTEAVNLGIKGLYWARQRGAPVRARPNIVLPGGEHHATVDTVEWLRDHEGATITHVDLDLDGRIDLGSLDEALASAESTALATMLWASNEIGTLQPVASVADRCARVGVPLHVDAVAAFGHVPVDFAAIRAASAASTGGLVALSVSAHKLGGPVGIGALILARDAVVEPLLHGGGQQRKLRSGTQDAAAAAAFATAASVANDRLETEAARLRSMRDRLVEGVLAAVPDVRRNGDPSPEGSVPGTAHFSFPGCSGDSLLFLLDAAGIAVSTGSACQAGVPEPSHVLVAIGRSEAESRGALRVTLGHSTTDADIDAFLDALPEAARRARSAGLS